MGKGHYQGGGTLLGKGTIAKAKGRKGGTGTAAAVEREKRRILEKKNEQALNKQIQKNQRIARELGKKWADEKKRKYIDQQVLSRNIKTSPLAAALKKAIDEAKR